MENWQFLIQKEGEHAWLPLESPNLQILEGRYRVVARSNRKHTAVEVRVSYFSTRENPPKRKVQKRSRRTNGEGLMAAIPFTYLKPGVWELSCSADIMSDLLGKPWQYTLKLNVLPGVQEDKQISTKQEEIVDKFVTSVVDTEVKTFETSRKAILSQPTVDKTLDIRNITPKNRNQVSKPVQSLKSKLQNQKSKTISISSEEKNQNLKQEENLKQEKVIPVGENLGIEDELFLSPSLENEVVEKNQATTDNYQNSILENTHRNLEVRKDNSEISNQETEILNPPEVISSKEAEKLHPPEVISNQETEIINSPEVISSNETEILNSPEVIANQETETLNPLEVISNQDAEIIYLQDGIPNNKTEILNRQETLLDNETEIINPIQEADIIDTEPAAIVLQRNFTITQFLDKQDDGVIDVSISPIWIQYESAEKILENLIDLALPSPESVLEDERFDNFINPSESLPLKLILDEENYFASWGEALTINGCLETQVIDNALFGDTLENYALCAGEVHIELRSPQESHIIAQIRQTLPEHLLPYNFNCSVNIPKDCQSKLILADISLYGTLDFATELILLANQSFSITADVNELLAFSSSIRGSTLELIDKLEAEPQWLKPPRPSAPIDLQLFNLVKSVKSESSLKVEKLPKKSLPPTLKARVNQKYIPHRSPKLPTFSESSIKQETLGNYGDTNYGDKKYTTLPFLRKQKNLPSRQELAVNNTPSLNLDKSNVHEYKELEKTAPEQIQEIEALITKQSINQEKINQEVQKQEEINQKVQQNQYFHNFPPADGINEENLEPLLKENKFIDETNITAVSQEENLQANEKTALSPLILKWMQSQGISLPEGVNNLNQSTNQSLNQNLVVDNLDDTNIIIDEDKQPEDRKVSLQEELPTSTSPIQPDTRRGEFIDNLVRNNDLNESTSTLAIKKAPTKVMQEVVVDDVEDELEIDTNFQPNKIDKQSQDSLSLSLSLNRAIIEVIPTPSLYVPDRELISGQSIIVRAELATVAPQVAIKLWVEDCQTRWLLDGPHWFSGLLPSPFGGLEVTAHLNVPFGCIEIRIEAIAIDLASKQESHKVSIVRSVVPPNLPVVKMDELLI
jgi:hypothetical protein